MSERPKPDIDIEAERPGFEQNITSFGWSLDRTPSGHYRYEHVEFRWRGFLARARRAAEREREMQHTIDEYTKRIEELETLLKRAHHPTCSMNCPSHVEISEGYGHCELCRKITEALKPKGPGDEH